MKKPLFIILALFVASTTLLAQKDGGGMQWGIKLGPSMTSWGGDDAEITGDEDKKMKIGMHGGIFLMVPISGNWYFQPELLYGTGGVIFEEGDEKATLSTSNLLLPLMIRMQMESGFYIILGPQLGFNLSGKVKYEAAGQEEEEDLEDLRSMIFSGNIGLGFRTKSGFGVYARYSKGFSKVFDYEDDDDDPKIYDSAITLSLFYMLGGKK